MATADEDVRMRLGGGRVREAGLHEPSEEDRSEEAIYKVGGSGQTKECPKGIQ
jgi:hypothetical protein